MPESLKQELVSLRRMSCPHIIFRVMTAFQPGGAKERAAILKALGDPAPATSPLQGVTSLRAWRRLYMRAQELDVALPDASILVAADTTKASVMFCQLSLRFSSMPICFWLNLKEVAAPRVKQIRSDAAEGGERRDIVCKFFQGNGCRDGKTCPNRHVFTSWQ